MVWCRKVLDFKIVWCIAYLSHNIFRVLVRVSCISYCCMMKKLIWCDVMWCALSEIIILFDANCMKNVKNNGNLIPINSFHRKSTAGVCESSEETIPSLHHPPTEILKNLKPHSLHYIRNYSLNEKSFKTVYNTSMNVLYSRMYWWIFGNQNFNYLWRGSSSEGSSFLLNCVVGFGSLASNLVQAVVVWHYRSKGTSEVARNLPIELILIRFHWPKRSVGFNLGGISFLIRYNVSQTDK